MLAADLQVIDVQSGLPPMSGVQSFGLPAVSVDDTAFGGSDDVRHDVLRQSTSLEGISEATMLLGSEDKVQHCSYWMSYL